MTNGRLASAIGMTMLLAGGCGGTRAPIGEAQSALDLCIGLVEPACCTDDDCNDDDDCTVDTCQGAVIDLIAGTCAHTPVDDPRCCNTPADCPQISGCGSPTCELEGNAWKDCGSNSTGSACCDSPSDCPTIACNTVACTSNACVYTNTPSANGCCATPADCGDGTRCQAWSCVSAQCVAVATQANGCCDDVADCRPNGCQDAHCQQNTCVYVARPGLDCCATDTDCAAMTVCGPSSCADNICIPPGGCATNDLGHEDLSSLGDTAASTNPGPVALAGGGGCQLARATRVSPAPWLLIVGCLLLVRRRSRMV